MMGVKTSKNIFVYVLRAFIIKNLLFVFKIWMKVLQCMGNHNEGEVIIW